MSGDGGPTFTLWGLLVPCRLWCTVTWEDLVILKRKAVNKSLLLLCSLHLLSPLPQDNRQFESPRTSHQIDRFRDFIMAEQPQIKPEPDTGSPFMDEVDETPDLEFFDKINPNDENNRMYLARLPNYVWQAWSKLDDDAEIEIGTIRQWVGKDGVLVSLATLPRRCWPSLTLFLLAEIANATSTGHTSASNIAQGVQHGRRKP